jgi:SulP family sulfate permease
MSGTQESKSATGAPDRIDFIPFKGIFSNFNPKNLGGDLAAAVNVALLAFPQGMAYALIAGIPLKYGIFGSAIAAIIGSIFAKSHYITLGPTNATSVLLLSAFAALQIDSEQKLLLIPLIVFLSAVLLIIGSIARIATLIQYISKSVISGYITAAAILIIANQTRNVLGIEFGEGVSASTFFDVLWNTFAALGRADLDAIIVAATSICDLPDAQPLLRLPAKCRHYPTHNVLGDTVA